MEVAQKGRVVRQLPDMGPLVAGHALPALTDATPSARPGAPDRVDQTASIGPDAARRCRRRQRVAPALHSRHHPRALQFGSAALADGSGRSCGDAALSQMAFIRYVSGKGVMADDDRQPSKTLVLTGASRGIGHATVKRFSREGWRVITCSRQAFAEDCPWPAGPDDHIHIDLSDPEDVGRTIAEIRHRLKADGSRLNALVNNAGISPKMPRRHAAQFASRRRCVVWRDVFQVNFFAPIMLARGLFKELATARARSST